MSSVTAVAAYVAASVACSVTLSGVLAGSGVMPQWVQQPVVQSALDRGSVLFAERAFSVAMSADEAGYVAQAELGPIAGGCPSCGRCECECSSEREDLAMERQALRLAESDVVQWKGITFSAILVLSGSWLWHVRAHQRVRAAQTEQAIIGNKLAALAAAISPAKRPTRERRLAIASPPPQSYHRPGGHGRSDSPPSVGSSGSEGEDLYPLPWPEDLV